MFALSAICIYIYIYVYICAGRKILWATPMHQKLLLLLLHVLLLNDLTSTTAIVNLYFIRTRIPILNDFIQKKLLIYERTCEDFCIKLIFHLEPDWREIRVNSIDRNESGSVWSGNFTTNSIISTLKKINDNINSNIIDTVHSTLAPIEVELDVTSRIQDLSWVRTSFATVAGET